MVSRVGEGVDVDSGVDPEHVLVPCGFGYGGVTCEYASDTLDWSQVLMTVLADFGLNVPVTHSAPERPDACEASARGVVRDSVLEVLPLFVHGTRVDESDWPELGVDPGTERQLAKDSDPGPRVVIRFSRVPPAAAVHLP